MSFLGSKNNYEGGKNSLCADGDMFSFFKVKTSAFESKLISNSIKFKAIKYFGSLLIFQFLNFGPYLGHI